MCQNLTLPTRCDLFNYSNARLYRTVWHGNTLWTHLKVELLKKWLLIRPFSQYCSSFFGNFQEFQLFYKLVSFLFTNAFALSRSFSLRYLSLSLNISFSWIQISFLCSLSSAAYQLIAYCRPRWDKMHPLLRKTTISVQIYGVCIPWNTLITTWGRMSDSLHAL